MKHSSKMAALLCCVLLALGVLAGCGSSSSGDSGSYVSPTPSETISQDNAENMARTTLVSTETAQIVGMTSAIPLSRTKLEDGPADEFFTTDLADVGTDGFVELPSYFAGAVIKIRLKTADGRVVNNDFLQGKQLGILGDYDWDNYFTADRPSVVQKQSYATNQTHAQIQTLGEYLVWSYMGPNWIDPQMPDGTPSVSSPSPGATDMLGGVDGNMTYVVEGETKYYDISIYVTTDTDGKPTGATAQGTFTYDQQVMTVTVTFTLDENGSPQSAVITGTSSDGYTLNVTVNSDGTGTGTIINSNGRQVATIDVSSDGNVTVSDNFGNTYTLNYF